MKVLTIDLEDKGDFIQVVTDTPTSRYTEKISWDASESNPITSLKHYLLGVISDMDWRKWLQKAVSEKLDQQ